MTRNYISLHEAWHMKWYGLHEFTMHAMWAHVMFTIVHISRIIANVSFCTCVCLQNRALLP